MPNLPTKHLENDGQKLLLLLANKKRPDGGVYTHRKLKTSSEMRQAAHSYLNDIRLAPERYVALPTAKTLDYSRFLKKYSDMDIERIHHLDELQRLLHMTTLERRLLEAQNNGTLHQIKLHDAAEVSQRRVDTIKRVAEYLLDNHHQFLPSESVQMINCAMKFHIGLDSHGALRLSNIKTTNQHNIMLLIGDFALKVQKYLRQGLHAKQSLYRGYVDYRDSIQEQCAILNMELSRQGWICFPQSLLAEDVLNLQKAIAGSGWCIEQDFDLTSEYLSKGDFWLYFEAAAAEIAVYMSHDGMEAFGRNEDQALEGKYELIFEKFRAQYNQPSVADDIDEDDYALNSQKRSLLKDMMHAISSGVHTRHLLKYAHVALEHKTVTLRLPSDISTLFTTEMIEQLPEVAFEDIVELHPDETMTIHASVCVHHSCEVLSQLIEVTGNLEMPRLSDIEIPHLKRIGGYLDIRNAEGLTFPELEEITGIVDAVGSSNIHMPCLKRSKQYIRSYYDTIDCCD